MNRSMADMPETGSGMRQMCLTRRGRFLHWQPSPIELAARVFFLANLTYI
jgi:hypothetical protein